LPKDTRQLLANFQSVPQNLVQAIVDANKTRKKFISDQILKNNPKVVGIYRLAMKAGSDNFRQSAIKDVLDIIKSAGVEVVIFEPNLTSKEFFGSRVVDDHDEFKRISDIIVANRIDDTLENVISKVYSRDIYGVD